MLVPCGCVGLCACFRGLGLWASQTPGLLITQELICVWMALHTRLYLAWCMLEYATHWTQRLWDERGVYVCVGRLLAYFGRGSLRERAAGETRAEQRRPFWQTTSTPVPICVITSGARSSLHTAAVDWITASWRVSIGEYSTRVDVFIPQPASGLHPTSEQLQ